MIGPRTFYVASGLFIVAGAALRLAPVRVPTTPARAVVATSAATPPLQPARADTKRYADIVASNPFSADRVAPRARFVPEGLRRDTVPVARAPRKPREVAPRLFGITRGPGGAVALIDADPAVPGAEVYEIGDPVRDGKVAAIGDSTVTLSLPSGRVVLRLPDAGERR
ncbi:MAG TPA: hypothetical protein VHG35_01555 [Gemmatimonadales bacterium]|nr:hypothetical protein [Gemmatimonadales bacterium]